MLHIHYFNYLSTILTIIKHKIMKKQLLKLTLFVAVLLSGSTLKAQEFEEYTTPGVHTINIPGEDLLMTIDPATLNVVWSPKAEGANAAFQEWTIQDHVTPSSAGLVQITAEIPGAGLFTLTTSTTDETLSVYDLAVRAGGPLEVEPLTGDYTGNDQFQRRKTSTSRGGNDALFLRLTWATNGRFGVTPTAAGEVVQFRFGGSIDKLEFKFVRDLPTASVNSFSADAFTISNPVNNFLNISGETSKINKVNVYSILGGKMLSRKIDNQDNVSINVNNLASGLYIVELVGESGSFTKKIVKQ